MRRRALTQTTTLLAVLVTLTAFLAGQAFAGVLTSGWSQFATWTAGGVERCISHKTTYFNDEPPVSYEESGYGHTRSRKGSTCGTNDIKDSGRLGVDVFVIRGDGTICHATGGWLYNIDPTYLLERGVIAGCAGADRRRAVSRSRAWRDATSEWVESGYQESPWDTN